MDDTIISFGVNFLANKDCFEESVNKVLAPKILNLRKQLKEESNIDVPLITIVDNLQIGKTEIVITIGDDTKWKQNFESIDAGDFDKVFDKILSELKKIYLAQ